MLHRDIPLIDTGNLAEQVASCHRNGQPLAGCGRIAIQRGSGEKRTALAIQRAFQRFSRQLEGCIAAHQGYVAEREVIVKYSTTRTNRGRSLAEGIPGKAQARLKQIVVALENRGA